MKITLTLDNGPDAKLTPQVLDILARKDVRAAFFVVGRQVETEGAEALLARMRAEGHRVGNHTWTHGTPLGELADPAATVEEIERTQAVIGEHADPDRLFRPFGGGGRIGPHLLSRAAWDHLRKGAYTCVLWNSVPGDWHDAEGWLPRALADVGAHDWTVTVLHDIYPGTVERLERFIDGARAAGATFRTDFPDDCVPLRCGRAGGDPSGIVAGDRA